MKKKTINSTWSFTETSEKKVPKTVYGRTIHGEFVTVTDTKTTELPYQIIINSNNQIEKIYSMLVENNPVSIEQDSEVWNYFVNQLNENKLCVSI